MASVDKKVNKMKPNSEEHSEKCEVCSRPCKYFFYGVKCCESCKHFFRRSISLKKEYKCKNGRKCEIEKASISCKRCRLNKCLSVGMNSSRVCVKSQRVSGQAAHAQSSNLAEVGIDLSAMTIALQQKDFVGFIMLKNLLEIEQKMRRIRYSQRPVPESFYEQCDSFESIFARKLNLLEMADKFSAKILQPVPSSILEKIHKFGNFCIRPMHMAMDLLCVFEIGKTFSFFEQLGINDKIALCSNIAMPLFVLCNGFYSVQQNCEVLCTPGGVVPIKCFKTSFYHKDSVAMRMGDTLLCKAIEPFSRLKLSNEEFVLIRAIIYSHMVSPGLSDQAQKLLFTEAEKYASLLMRIVQISYGAAPGALRYVELMGLIEFVFNTGAKHRQLLTYISNVLDPSFDRVMPPILAKICTKGPVELHQLLPY
ncbi:hypothetical protein niasHT_037632 [Heterodera trifolii]|uniref:Uncharacterized protein n=1 Tax=Heterodera trifolii TaxID=157864 RepID=A0ABD2IQC1_9BILA